MILSHQRWLEFQYRKRYGLHAILACRWSSPGFRLFQYRKRYGLHAIKRIITSVARSHCFNTASGMDCMQLLSRIGTANSLLVSIPQAVWIACNDHERVVPQSFSAWFQYRKRYGLHAIIIIGVVFACDLQGFNTASGMDCMQ